MQKGMQKGEQELVLRLLRRKLGDLDALVAARIESLPREVVEELGEALLASPLLAT